LQCYEYCYNLGDLFTVDPFDDLSIVESFTLLCQFDHIDLLHCAFHSSLGMALSEGAILGWGGAVLFATKPNLIAPTAHVCDCSDESVEVV
jgi:hypothetical protein